MQNLRQAIDRSRAGIVQRFSNGEHARVLVPELATETDAILIETWRRPRPGVAGIWPARWHWWPSVAMAAVSYIPIPMSIC